MAKVYFLGTGGAGSYVNRGYPAYLVETNSKLILLDAGFGVDAKLHSLGFRVCDLDLVLISHEHFDHLLGITGLLNALVEERCSKQLVVYGPQRAVEAIPLIIERTGPRNAPKPVLKPLDIDFNEISLGDVTIKSIPVDHSVPTLGYSISTRDSKIVYSADTRPTRNIVEEAQGAQILLHEASMPSNMLNIALVTKHTTIGELKQFLGAAELLAPVHIMHVAEEELRKISGRKIIIPVDGLIVSI